MKRTLSGLAIGLAKGEVTSLALVKLALQAAKESEYVFTEIFFEESLNAAKASDERRARGLPLSPFDGIPIAIKDLFDIKGSSTLAGSKTRLEVEPAEKDSEIVANVIGAGMIPLGKVNLVEFAFSGLGLNPHFGTPSPDFKHVKPRIPGGSSSGSAVAVQRGIVCCSLGTDTGGSVRVPAAFNGLVGFKSTPHRYPMGGIFPLAPSLDSPGPITTTVEDCVLLDQVMRGEPIGLPDPVSLTQLEVIVDPALLDDPDMQPEVRDNFNEWISNLRELGVKVTFRRIETFWEAKKLIAEQGWLGAIEAWNYHKELLTGPRKGELDQRVQQRMSAAGDLPASVVNTIRTRRPQLIAAIAEELNGALFAMPTVKHVAPELAPLEKDVNLFASTNRATNDYTMVASYLNVPGIAMPNGVGEMGLPVSVLLSGASGSDDTVLNTALTLEKALSKFNYI